MLEQLDRWYIIESYKQTRQGCEMFKPEYILDNVALFGYYETIALVKAKFQRLGKGAKIAQLMATELVSQTVWVEEITLG